MTSRIARILAQSLLVIFLASWSSLAQQSNVGGITGTVQDTTGAVIPDAQVDALNQATQASTKVVTNSNGIYRIPVLPIGTYTVTVTKEGFERFVRADIPVESGEAFTVDVSLTVGAVTQTVTVTGTGALLDTTTVNEGTTRSPEEISELPIPMMGNAARAAVSIIQTMAGVNYDVSSGQAWMVISRASINGIEPGTQGYQIDGVDAGMGEGESAEDFGHPTPDMVSEVRLTTNTDVSSGFNGGVTIAMTTKSGTNQVHGEVSYYNRNGAFDARSDFLPGVGKDIQNEYGVAIGGPVYIPHLYDGRNKTFFFADFNSYHFVNNGSLSYANGTSEASVPTLLERQGNFSESLGTTPLTNTDGTPVLDESGNPTYAGEIFDPATTKLLPNGSYTRDPFKFNGQLNVIDPARLSSVSQYLGNGFKPPTSPGIGLNWTGFPYEAILFDQRYFIKIDHSISEKHRISFSLQKPNTWGLPQAAKGPTNSGRGHSDDWEGNGWLEPSVANGFFTNNGEDRYILNYVWTVNANSVFSFRTGMNRVPKRSIETYPNQQVINGAVLSGLKGTLATEAPTVSIIGLSGATSGPGGLGPSYNQDFWYPQKNSLTADMTTMKGNHDIKYGVEYLGQFDAFFHRDGGEGYFNFGPLETGLPGAPKTGGGYASFLLGEVDSASVSSPINGRSGTGGIAFFAQDSWRVTHKLTVNAGLRWDYFIPLHMRYNEMSSFDPTMPNPGAGGRLGALAIYGAGAGRNGLTNAAMSYDKAFGPKLGFAYSINPKTVFRASFGISYLPYYQKWAGDVQDHAPADGFSATRTALSTNSGITPAFNWQNGFPLTFPAFPIVDPTLDNGNGIGYVDRKDDRPSMSENIAAEVERELPGKVLLRVGYVGTMAHRLFNGYNMDQLPLADLKYGLLLNDQIGSPSAVAAGITAPYPGFTGTVAQALLPYPQYTSVTDIDAQTGNSTYNALQVNVQRQFGSLTFLANYTASKILANQWYGGATYTPSTNAQSPAQLNDEKALAGPFNGNGDKPKILNISWVWDVPVGRGRRYLGSTNGALNQIVGGWLVTANQTYESGEPLYVTSSNTSIPFLGGGLGIYPNLVAGVPAKSSGGCSNSQYGGFGTSYLNPAAFTDPLEPSNSNPNVPYTLGNVSTLPTVRLCGYLNEDLGIQKAFPFREHARVVYGANAQNIFNRHYLTGLSTNIDVPSQFGRFNGGSAGRSVQMYLRIEF